MHFQHTALTIILFYRSTFQYFVLQGLNMAYFPFTTPSLDSLDDKNYFSPNEIQSNFDIRLLSYSQLSRLLKDIVHWNQNG